VSVLAASALLLLLPARTSLVRFDATPEATVRAAFAAMSRSDAAGFLRRVDTSSTDLAAVRRELGRPNAIKILDLSSNVAGSTAKVTARISFEDRGGAIEMKMPIDLVRRGEDWRIESRELIDPRKDPRLLNVIAFRVANPRLYTQARTAAKKTVCLSNVKQLGVATIIYGSDHRDRFPASASAVRRLLSPYVKKDEIWSCPAHAGGTSYSFNPNLIGKSMNDVEEPAKTVLLYEGSQGRLAYRHDGVAAVVYADGHAKLMTPQQAKGLRWKP